MNNHHITYKGIEQEIITGSKHRTNNINLLDLIFPITISFNMPCLLNLLKQSPFFPSFSTLGHHCLWFQIGKQNFTQEFDYPASNEIDYHRGGQLEFELRAQGKSIRIYYDETKSKMRLQSFPSQQFVTSDSIQA